MTENNEIALDTKEFIELSAGIKDKIKGNDIFNGIKKNNAIAILDAMVKSAKVNGLRQHGITKKKLKDAFEVYATLMDEKSNTDEERAVYNTFLLLTLAAINR